MTLDEIRYFLAVAEAGSISRAAVRLCVSQPALSRRIQDLEQGLRSKLLYRHGRGVVLTPAGEKLLSFAEPWLAELEATREGIREASNKASGLVTLGVPPSIGATICAPLAARFTRTYPEAHLRIHEGFSGTLSEWIEQGEIDLAVLYDVRRRRDLSVTPLLLEGLYLIRKPDGPAEPPDWSQVARQRLILTGPKNGLRMVIERSAREAGVVLDARLEVDSVSTIRQLVMAGEGVSILPYGAVHADVAAGELTAEAIAGAELNALLVVAMPSNKAVSKITRAVVELIKDEISLSIASGKLRGSRA